MRATLLLEVGFYMREVIMRFGGGDDDDKALGFQHDT